MAWFTETMQNLPAVRRQSLAEITAAHIREGLNSGRWSGRLPGVQRLAEECDVSRQTLRAALRLLEDEGALLPGGNGRSRTVTGNGGGILHRSLRIGVLLRERFVDEDPDQQTFFLQLRHALEAAGHECLFAEKSQNELGDSLLRIQRHLHETGADGWIVISGTRELLEWGITSPVPLLAVGGHARSLPIASTGADSAPAYRAAVRHLVSLGHRRIILLTPHQFRHPAELHLVQEFKEQLEAGGIEPTPYHVPDWEESPQGLEQLLDSLFRMTPPTAILTLKAKWTIGVLSFLGRRKLAVPEDVSVVSWSCDSELAWHRPPLAHFISNQELMVRRIARWAAGLMRGRPDRKMIPIPLKFVPGSTTGPAKSGLKRP